MVHKSAQELRQILKEAKKQVPIGSSWAHYRHPDLYYKVIDIVIYEADDEPMVIYEALYESLAGVPFARSMSIFLEKIDHDGKTVTRFMKVG